MPSVKPLTVTKPLSPTQIAAALALRLPVFGRLLIINVAPTLNMLAGEQPSASSTTVIVTTCAADALVRLAAGIVKMPVPPVIVTMPVKPVARFGAPRLYVIV